VGNARHGWVLAGQFIMLHVNDFTRDYGEIGRAAIRISRSGSERGFVPAAGENWSLVE
jgi:predicted solute-binding protein